MNRYIPLILCLLGFQAAMGQYVYTIKADSVKITNCDSAELIIENHTQNIPGFLYNTGNGRTIFKRAVQKLNDSLFLIGADTLKVLTTNGDTIINGRIGLGGTLINDTTTINLNSSVFTMQDSNPGVDSAVFSYSGNYGYPNFQYYVQQPSQNVQLSLNPYSFAGSSQAYNQYYGSMIFGPYGLFASASNIMPDTLVENSISATTSAIYLQSTANRGELNDLGSLKSNSVMIEPQFYNIWMTDSLGSISTTYSNQEIDPSVSINTYVSSADASETSVIQEAAVAFAGGRSQWGAQVDRRNLNDGHNGGIQRSLATIVYSDTVGAYMIRRVDYGPIDSVALMVVDSSGNAYVAKSMGIGKAPGSPLDIGNGAGSMFNVGSNGVANYGADYGSLFTNRSLVDKGYVDSSIASISGSGAASLVRAASLSTTILQVTAGRGAGSGASVSISGSNQGGLISLTTGSSPAASTIVATVTYSGSGFAHGSYVITKAANAATALLEASSGNTFVNGSTGGFTITANISALASGTTYQWNYIVVGN